MSFIDGSMNETVDSSITIVKKRTKNSEYDLKIKRHNGATKMNFTTWNINHVT